MDNLSSAEAKSLNVKPLSQEQTIKFDEMIEYENLDTSQVRAIETALSSHLSVIQGTPGTGKTKTLVALLQFLDHPLFALSAEDTSNARERQTKQ